MIAFSSPDSPVLVVGGGPAGATAARALAVAGLPVRLLERAPSYPRNKPCGGGISMRALRRFPYLANALPRIATHEVSRLYLEGPDGSSTVIDSGEPACLLIRRVEFDALLASLAAQASADVVTGVEIVQASQNAREVTLTSRDGRTFRSPLVIAADGVHSVVARRLGLNRGWPGASVALDMMEETPRDRLRDVDPSMLWVCYGYKPVSADAGLRNADSDSRLLGTQRSALRAVEGYAYIFPKRDHVNIGLGYVLDYFRRRIDAAPYDLQRRFVAELRDRGVVVGESARDRFTPSIIPVGGPLRRPAGGRVLLAGDAGGFVNAFTAEGIFYAMVSGDLAARAAIASAADPTAAAANYCRACDYEIGGELRDSVLIQRYLFADARRIGQVIAGAHRERAVTRLVLDLAVGRRSYREVRRRILMRSPGLLARMIVERFRNRSLPRAAAITTI